MALPVTNLTSNIDASLGGKVWQAWQAGTPYHNTPGADGAFAVVVQDAGGADVAIINGVVPPFYRTVTPLMLLSCLDFDGVDDRLKFWNDAGSVAKTLANLHGASAKTFSITVYAEGATLNDAAPYNNHFIYGDDGGFFGLFLRTSGGLYYLQAYNWDGNADFAEKQILLNTSYVVTVTHNGTNISISLDGGSATTAASGATTDTSGSVAVGGRGATTYFNGRFGEIATYNAVLSGTDITDLNSYFTSKWLGAAPPSAFIPIIGRGPGMALVSSGGLAA